jgi:DNA-binding GntR family transcriptional regulator
VIQATLSQAAASVKPEDRRMTEDAVPPARPLPRRHVLADDVYEAIKAMVMDHVVRPGARVSIDGLARELAVSPTPVREALARLESDGLVVKEPLKGYRATSLLTLEELDDLFAFRRLIEPWAARRAAERITPEGARLLRDEMRSASAPLRDDYEGYKALTAHDARFHSLVARLSGSEQVRAAFERTHCHLHIFRLHYEQSLGRDALTEHRRIVDAVVGGDAAAAEAAMLGHLEAAMGQRLRKVYQAPSSTTG